MTTEPRKRLSGNSDLFWVVFGGAVCALLVAVLLQYLSLRHQVYQLGYETAALTHEHNLLLEENRRLVVETAVQGNAERLEIEALERLGLQVTSVEQIQTESESE